MNPDASAEQKDFSQLEVNRSVAIIMHVVWQCVHEWREVILIYPLLYRPIRNVRRLTRETLITDIETRQWCSKFLSTQGLPAEHPRSSTTDDIECFFSILSRERLHLETSTCFNNTWFSLICRGGSNSCPCTASLWQDILSKLIIHNYVNAWSKNRR